MTKRILTFDLALTALVLVGSSLGQTSPGSPQIFESSDSVFEFSFPKSFVVCQAADGGWAPAESCWTYIPICEGSSPASPQTVACVAYPASVYKGTNLGGAAFSVGEAAGAIKQAECLQFDELTTNPKKAHWQTIGGVKFRANSGGEGGLRHGLSKDIFMVFHNGKCYDLEIRTTGTSIDNFPSGAIKEFRDSQRMNAEMRRILDSFRFLK